MISVEHHADCELHILIDVEGSLCISCSNEKQCENRLKETGNLVYTCQNYGHSLQDRERKIWETMAC